MTMRSHWAGELRAEHVGQEVVLCGWVDGRREHGEHLAFVDLRDRSGIVQCVVDGAHDIRSEYVVRITGTVQRRPEGYENDRLATGEVEVKDCTVEVLSAAEPPPFPIDDRIDVDEIVRLRHRYLDLRRPRMQRNLTVRAMVNSALRRAMERQGFTEVETPMLMPSTPEGARVHRSVAPEPRLVLCAAAEPAALQAAADGRGRRPLLPDRPLPPR